jgi:hypothetical protein
MAPLLLSQEEDLMTCWGTDKVGALGPRTASAALIVSTVIRIRNVNLQGEGNWPMYDTQNVDCRVKVWQLKTGCPLRRLFEVKLQNYSSAKL